MSFHNGNFLFRPGVLANQITRITGFAGWQAEYHVYLCGLDIEEKCKWTEDQVRAELGDDMLKRFTVLKFMQNGTSVSDARNQDVATVDFRIFAQSKDRDLLKMRNPDGFFRRAMTTFLQSCPVSATPTFFRLSALQLTCGK